MFDDTLEHGPASGHAVWHGAHFAAWHGGSHHFEGRGHGSLHGYNLHGFFGGHHGMRHFGGGRGWGGRGHGHGRGGHGGWGDRERLERGLLRYIILDLLRDGPKHGYEIMKQIEERTGGRYSPSPGTLYPTLQYLEELGLIRANQEVGKRAYELTDEGRAHLEEHSDSAEDFWSRFHGRAPSSAVMHEVTFLRDAMNDLNRTIGGSLRSAIFASDADTVRKVRLLLERTQNEIRELISQSAGAQPVPGEGQEDSDPDNAQGPDQNPQATQKF